jgi:hypothetical protein
MKKIFAIVSMLFLLSCSRNEKKKDMVSKADHFEILSLSSKEAGRLAATQLRLVEKEYPYRMGQTIGSKADLGSPSKLHPAFYGYGSWNNSVQGYMLLVKFLKKFPHMSNADSVRMNLSRRLSAANINAEVLYFQGRYSKPFQRTGGWNSLLLLAKELHTWNDTLGRKLETNLQPLTNLIVNNYLEFLPKVEYSSKGTAAGFAIAFDYAVVAGSDSLKAMISGRSKDFYQKDVNYKLSSGSPDLEQAVTGLQEADIMRRVLPKEEFRTWLSKFIPELSAETFRLAPTKMTEKKKKTSDIDAEEEDQVDMSRVDRINFNKAQCLIAIADELPEYEHLRTAAYENIIYSLPNVVVKDEIKLKLLQLIF